jgi:hypothetical protein
MHYLIIIRFAFIIPSCLYIVFISIKLQGLEIITEKDITSLTIIEILVSPPSRGRGILDMLNLSVTYI